MNVTYTDSPAVSPLSLAGYFAGNVEKRGFVGKNLLLRDVVRKLAVPDIQVQIQYDAALPSGSGDSDCVQL